MAALLSASPRTLTPEQGYAQCAELAQTHYENFTVGSWLLPRRVRKHLYAIYACCRHVDDLGDEHGGNRLEALDAWEADLLRCYSGTPHHPYLIALQQTIRQFDVPREPFLRLVEANRMDQTASRYPTYADLENYCEHSANPVGRMVLYVFGYRDEERQRLSDYTCTALQLANFWQDVSRDYAMGRVYIPLEDMRRFGYTESELEKGACTDAFRDLMAFEVQRARELFHRGLGLVNSLDGRLKLDIALFTKGGVRVLDLIENQGYNVLERRPVMSSSAKARMLLGTAVRMALGAAFTPVTYRRWYVG